MTPAIALIGFGEAGRAFAAGQVWAGTARAFDIKITDPASSLNMRSAQASAGVTTCTDLADALDEVPLILSVVTAASALEAAQSAASFIRPNAIYCDLNSVAPDTKRAAAKAIEAAGGRYVDVAIMAPVEPARRGVPLLLSGPDAEEAAGMLSGLGFSNLQIVGDSVGRASAIKMIRSVVVKGIEALSAECALAAAAAEVSDEVFASLDASETHKPWAERIEYNLGRMREHGLRRAEEMEEAAITLQSVGVEPVMTRGTIRRQRELAASPSPTTAAQRAA